MKSKKILVIDRRRAILEHLKLIFEQDEDVSIYSGSDTEALSHINFDLVLKHVNEPWNGIANASLRIAYSGGGITNLREDEYGFHIGVGPRNVAEVFTRELLESFLNYADNKTDLPESLSPPDYFYRVKQQYESIVDFLPQKSYPFTQLNPPGKKEPKGLFIGNENRHKEVLNQLISAFECEIPQKNCITNHDAWLAVCGESGRQLELESFECVFVAEELTWVDRRPFNGVGLVAELRRIGATVPIIMLGFSSDSERLARQRNDPGSQILKTPLIFRYLLDQARLEEDNHIRWNEMHEFGIEKLSPSQLGDIQFYALDWMGLLHEAIHDLRYPYVERHWKDESNDDQADLVQAYIDEKIWPLLLHTQPSEQAYRNSVNLIREAIVQSTLPLDATVIRGIVRSHERLWETLLPGGDVQRLPVSVTQAEWGVLIVDDQQEDRHAIKKVLESEGFQVCLADSGAEAIRRLQEDANGELMIDKKNKPANFITVLVSDWRMFKNGDPEQSWQLFQGPDLIMYVQSKLKNRIEFLVMTGKAGGILKQIQKSFGSNIAWFSKERVLPKDAMDQVGFIEQVSQVGNSIYKELLHRPGKISAAWTSRLEPTYQAYREAPINVREKVNQEIENLAVGWIENLAGIGIEEAIRNPPNLDKISNLGAKLKPIGAAPSPSNFDYFINKMAARRILLGLSIQGWSHEQIAFLLRDGILEKKSVLDSGTQTHLDQEIEEKLGLPMDEDHTWLEEYLLDKAIRSEQLKNNTRTLSRHLAAALGGNLAKDGWAAFRTRVAEATADDIQVEVTLLAMRNQIVIERNRQFCTDLINTHLALSIDSLLKPLRESRKFSSIDPETLLIEEVLWIEKRGLTPGISDRTFIKTVTDLVLTLLQEAAELILRNRDQIPSKDSEWASNLSSEIKAWQNIFSPNEPIQAEGYFAEQIVGCYAWVKENESRLPAALLLPFEDFLFEIGELWERDDYQYAFRRNNLELKPKLQSLKIISPPIFPR